MSATCGRVKKQAEGCVAKGWLREMEPSANSLKKKNQSRKLCLRFAWSFGVSKAGWTEAGAARTMRHLTCSDLCALLKYI